MRAFDYDGIRTTVRTPAPATLDWLEEFFAPWFGADAGEAPVLLDVRVGPDAVRGAMDGAEPTGHPVDCFTMDDARADWMLLRGRDGAGLAREPDLGAVLRKRPGVVDLFLENERPEGRLLLLRTLRELAGSRATRRGDLPLHAAAVAVDGHVTLFTGGKRSGKTTLLLHALRDPAARLVANDRVYARGTTARGMPTVISLREDTLERVPGLRATLATGAWHHASTVGEARAHRAAGTVAPGARRRWPPGLSAAQLCVLADVRAVAGGELERIVFPRVDPAADRFDLRALDPAEAHARLLKDGLLAGGRMAGFLAEGTPPARAAREASARELVERLPCFSCRLGPRAYEAPGVWDALREAGRS